VDRARQLFIYTDQSIAQIAASVGFADQSHLNRHFKKAFGITPGAFMLSK
jgi:AraC family transcriptional regulator